MDKTVFFFCIFWALLSAQPNYVASQQRSFERRYLIVENSTPYNLIVNVQYFTETTSGRWEWFGAAWKFIPGERAYLDDDNFKVNAKSIYIWAKSDQKEWSEYKSRSLQIGDNYTANQMADYTFRFIDESLPASARPRLLDILKSGKTKTTAIPIEWLR